MRRHSPRVALVLMKDTNSLEWAIRRTAAMDCRHEMVGTLAAQRCRRTEWSKKTRLGHDNIATKMKLKFICIHLAGLMASGLIASAQTTAPIGDSTTPAVPAVSAAPVTLAAADTTPAPSTTPAAADTASSPADLNPTTNFFSMEQVPLRDAIKNLARQAKLNYLLDPHIPLLSPGPDGHIQEPLVDLRLENVTADQALYALLNNYNLQVVDDPKTKVARITVKDPAAPDPLETKIVQLKYADPTNMLGNVQTVLLDKRSKVVADGRTSQLVVIATDKELAAVDDLVARLDRVTPEVLIEAKLVETSRTPHSAHGVDWSGTAAAQNVSFGNNVLGGQGGRYSTTIAQQPLLGFAGGSVITNGLLSTITYGQNNLIQSPGLLVDTAKGFNPATAFLDADGVNAVMSFLNTQADAKVLSTPKAVTMDNQEAVLSVTRAQPIFNTTAGTQGSPGGSQVIYTNIGTILHVTPRISANDTVNLKVIPEVSDFAFTLQKTVASEVFQADVFDVRRMETQVRVPSGNTLVMGGLVSDNSTKNSTKVPILGDIPILGWAFRSDTKDQDKKDLLIFLTPTIVRDDDFQPTQSTFLKTRLDERPAAELGAWDSGEPQDWSKLMHKNSSPSSTSDDGRFAPSK